MPMRSEWHDKGTWNLSQETLNLFYKAVDGCQMIPFPDPTHDDMKRLYAACQPATFGLNKEDVLDESYRNARKLDRSHFAINLHCGGAQLENAAAKLSDMTHRATVELYNLNVYGPGSFFKAHKDTPRGKGMFGSLVVVLPTNFEGGELVVRHGGEEHTYDATADFKDPKNKDEGLSVVSWIAFYSDVEHEVLPVKSGYRVTLTYNLYRAPLNLSVFPAMSESPLRKAFHEAISDPSFLPSGGLLGFGLTHEYPVSYKHSDKLAELPLKGADQALMNVIAGLGLKGEVKAVYLPEKVQLDEYQQIYVMSSTFPLLKDYNSQSGQSRRILVLSEGGTLFLSSFCHPLSEPEYELPQHVQDRLASRNLPTVQWITPLSETTRFQSAYLAYVNQASLGYVYANMNIIVDVPPFEARKAMEP